MVEPSGGQRSRQRRRTGWMREQVLETIRASERPISAWVIARELSVREEGIHTSGVFRAVNELMAAGLVERIETLACYVPRRPSSIGTVCIECGVFQEVAAEHLADGIVALAQIAGWTADRLVMEVLGRCSDCHAARTVSAA